jgi:hypothetical protein
MLVRSRHITYFSWLDQNAFTMESGKYFEVVGHVTFDLDQDNQITRFNQEWVNTSRSASPHTAHCTTLHARTAPHARTPHACTHVGRK